MAYLPCYPALRSNQSLTAIVKDYFRKGYSNLEMLEFLKVLHKKQLVYLLLNVT